MNISGGFNSSNWLRIVVLGSVIFVVVMTLFKSKTSVLKSPFEIEASEQWIVRQDNPGEVMARHTLGRRQTIQGMKVYRYERNDLISLNLNTNLTEGMVVPANYPVLIIDSLNDNSQKKILEARKKRLQSQVKMLISGPFQAKISEAKRVLALNQTNLLTYLPEFQRATNMVARGITSQYEGDIAVAEYYELKQEVNVAREKVLVRQQEVSPAIVSMAKFELEETVCELDMVNSRITNRWLKTPIPGRLTRSSGNPEILLRIINENKLYARIIVNLDYYDDLHVGDDVQLHLNSKNNCMINSKIEYITVESLLLVGQSVAHVLVAIDNADLEFSVAMTGEALFPNVSIHPIEMIMKRFKKAFRKSQTVEKNKL